MNNSLIDELEIVFKKEFTNIFFEYKNVTTGRGEVHAFFFYYDCEKDLEDTWQKIINTIAVYFQSKLDDFGKWNTYVFYRTKFEPSENYRNLKYKIEKDIFYSRKIVVEGDRGVDALVEEHILGENLKIVEINQLSDSLFTKNITIVNALKDKIVREKRVKKEVAIGVLNDLYKALKEVNDEV